MRILTFWACIASLFLVTACSLNTSDSTIQDAELKALVDMWQGEYAPDPNIAGPIHPYVLVRSVELPKFGEQVIYMETRDRTRDGNVLRQRLYVFDTSLGRSKNTIKAYDFWAKSGAPYAGAYDEPARLNDLDPQTMYTFPEGCAIEWRSENGGYIGEVSSTRCHIPSRTRGKTVSVDMILGVSQDHFTQWEVGYDESRNLEFGDPSSPPIQSNRIRAEM